MQACLQQQQPRWRLFTAALGSSLRLQPRPCVFTTPFRAANAATSSSAAAAAAAPAPAPVPAPAAAAAAAAERRPPSQPRSRPPSPQPVATAGTPPGQRAKQTVDYTTLAACCHELNRDWAPAKVEEVVQPDAYTLSLRLRTPLAQGWLHLSWHPVAARVAVGAAPPRGAVSEVFSFVEQVTSALRGLVLTRAVMPVPWERLVALEFAQRLTDAPSKRLMCEVMAKYSNVVLTDERGVIVAAAHQVGGSMSSMRLVQQGRPFQPPPPAAGLPPDPLEALASWRANITGAAAAVAAAASDVAAGPGSSSSSSSGSGNGSSSEGDRVRRKRARHDGAAALSGAAVAAAGSLAAGMVRAYQGVSPSLAAELCHLAGVEPAVPPPQLADAHWLGLHEAWRGWQQRLETSQFDPCSCGSTGSFGVLGAYPQRHPSVHALLDAQYSSLQAAELHASLHQRLTAAVKNGLKKARGRVYAFQQQLKTAADVGAVQRRADLIMANVYRWPAGAASIMAEDWDTGEQVALSVPDADTTPVEAAEQLYKRARKLRRATVAVEPLLLAAEQEVEYLEQLESDVGLLGAFGGMADLQALREVQEELVEAKLVKPPAEAALAAKAASKSKQASKKSQKAAAKKGGGPSAAAAAAAGGLGCREFVSPGGLQVLVGRNNKQNDVLSLQIANPQDVWMHVRGIPGSHCLLRVPNKAVQPAQEDFQFAANLAAFFSRARDATKVEVLVTRAEHVKKLKGGKPGQVMVTKEAFGGVMARPGDCPAAQQQQD